MLVEKIGKLLNLAENASTQEEADAFMAKAQFLATRESIDLAKARAAIARLQDREEPTMTVVPVAEYSNKSKKHMVNLYLAIARANGLRCNISGDSTAVHAYGFESDIEVVNTLFNSLSIQMVDRANAWLASKEYKKETTPKYCNKTHMYVDKPIDGRVARSNFYQTFISAISLRFLKIAGEAQKQMMEEDTTTGTELVIVEKEKEVNSYYSSNSKARGSWSGPSQSGYSSKASSAGRKAGESATLSGAKSFGSQKRALTS